MQRSGKQLTVVDMVTAVKFLFRVQKEEIGTDGSLVVLSAVGTAARTRISFHSTQGCIHLLTGLQKLWTVSSFLAH